MTVEFPVYIDCTYLNGKYDDHWVARHGYAADAPFIEKTRDARYHYAKRFGIESSYRLSEQAIETTTTRDATVRLLYVVVSLLLQNAWQASPLVVAVQGVRESGSRGRVDGPRGASGRPRESTTRRPVPPVVTDQVRRLVSGNAVASAAERRRQRELRLQAPLINRYRRLSVTEQVIQVRLADDAL